QKLRELRDNTFLATKSGTAFITEFNQLYYSFSPTIADMERENPILKETIKIVLTPMLTSLSLLNHVDINSEQELLAYGIGIILVNIGMYFVAPTMIIYRIRK
ncbi:MAG: peptidylprolyl isomerase, partial [Nitrosopumilus sp.]|nr:peptidylprolyl isomerase [Nitrosopumilus sp.]